MFIASSQAIKIIYAFRTIRNTFMITLLLNVARGMRQNATCEFLTKKLPASAQAGCPFRIVFALLTQHEPHAELCACATLVVA